MPPSIEELLPSLRAIVENLRPGATLLSARPFGVDDGAADSDGTTLKGIGYGQPLRLDLRLADGTAETLVFHTAKPDAFGHDRRSDRAADMLLAHNRFGGIPYHVPALDVGALRLGRGAATESADSDAAPTSLAGADEFYLITGYAEGQIYATELRQIGQQQAVTTDNLRHVEQLAHALCEIHSEKITEPLRYKRAIRDLVGSGEGIFGLIDAYGDDVPAAPLDRIQNIERLCDSWRWKLREKTHRLSRSHGDFHPFNIIFSSDHQLALLDSSRGSMGDPADDVSCLAINFIFFALEHPGSWQAAYRQLFHRFFELYLSASQDQELLSVCAPFFAWRGLVIANPVWYPKLSAGARGRMLCFIEQVLLSERFDPKMADGVFS